MAETRQKSNRLTGPKLNREATSLQKSVWLELHRLRESMTGEFTLIDPKEGRVKMKLKSPVSEKTK